MEKDAKGVASDLTWGGDRMNDRSLRFRHLLPLLRNTRTNARPAGQELARRQKVTD